MTQKLAVEVRGQLDGVGPWLLLDSDDDGRLAASRSFAALQWGRRIEKKQANMKSPPTGGAVCGRSPLGSQFTVVFDGNNALEWGERPAQGFGDGRRL
jgi:hypothetical protein